jgi:hypothetical protein
MVPVFLLRSAASRFQYPAMKARASGIATNRYLTGNSGSTPVTPRTSPENPATASGNKDPSSGSPPPPPPTPTKDVYIHPLSQIVLQNLQSEECHEWIMGAGLDRNLTVHKDGTFSLESLTARIWTEYCPDEKKHWLIYSSSTGSGRSSSSADDYMNQSETTTTASTNVGVAAGTTTVQHKYLLQDNLRTAWQKGTKSSSAPDRIQEFVRELMLTVR